jgi:hypothetical protein
VVLIHLSRDCNHPDVVRGLWSRSLPALAPRVVFAHHALPTPIFRLRGGALEGANP